jgi:Uncharacterized protein conserved in bacteria (DUF2252)
MNRRRRPRRPRRPRQSTRDEAQDHPRQSIHQATRSYERWLRRCTSVVESDLRDKHGLMRRDPFMFLRGAYYRWAQLWPACCPDAVRAPRVLAVGDLHVGSFGTWRDAEGRLAWGVDDFDEAYPLPYTNDLVRLAASLKIANETGSLSIKLKPGCDAILEGYAETLRSGGCPIVLAEGREHLEKLGLQDIKAPDGFWKKLNRQPTVRGRPPRSAVEALRVSLPDPNLPHRFVRRQAGTGSLGQERFVAIAQCNGGYIAREAKAVVPSASAWLAGRVGKHQSYYQRIMRSAARSPDPFQRIAGTWLIRRLSPDSNPIDIEELPKQRDEAVLLHAMGAETANVHVGSPRRATAILRDLRGRKQRWLRDAARTMAEAMHREWRDYRS